jgi:hypothetical protein
MTPPTVPPAAPPTFTDEQGKSRRAENTSDDEQRQ